METNSEKIIIMIYKYGRVFLLVNYSMYIHSLGCIIILYKIMLLKRTLENKGPIPVAHNVN